MMPFIFDWARFFFLRAGAICVGRGGLAGARPKPLEGAARPNPLDAARLCAAPDIGFGGGGARGRAFDGGGATGDSTGGAAVDRRRLNAAASNTAASLALLVAARSLLRVSTSRRRWCLSRCSVFTSARRASRCCVTLLNCSAGSMRMRARLQRSVKCRVRLFYDSTAPIYVPRLTERCGGTVGGLCVSTTSAAASSRTYALKTGKGA